MYNMIPPDTYYVSEVGSVVGPQYRRIVAGMGRAELEDRHFSLMEENHVRLYLQNLLQVV